MKTPVCFLALLLLLAGCRKKNTVANTSFTVRNELAVGANVHFYSTLADKLQDRARIASGYVGPGQSWEMPITTFPANQPVYADWYSDDFGYTNWAPGDSAETFRYELSAHTLNGSTLTSLWQAAPLIARKLLINGNTAKTSWKAVAMRYQPLPANEVYEVTFSRDGAFLFNDNGTQCSGRYEYAETPESPYQSAVYLNITMRIDQPTPSIVSLRQGNNWGSPKPLYKSDTLQLYRNGSSAEILFIKVP